MDPKIVEIIVWPAAAVIAFAVVCFIFRKSITDLIARTSRAGYGSTAIEFESPKNVAEQQKSAPSSVDAPSAATVPAQAAAPPPSEIYAAIEKEIYDALTAAHFPADLEKAWLVRTVAATRIARAHEIAYRLILGSQIGLLLAANTATPPDMIAARAMYDNAKTSFPAVFQNFPFETWINWPVNSGLLKIDYSKPPESVVRITAIGQDFLHYLVANSLTSPKAG